MTKVMFNGASSQGKPEAKLRLYVGGNVKARLDVALPRFYALAQMGLDLARGRGRAEPRLGSTPNVEPELCLRLAPLWAV